MKSTKKYYLLFCVFHTLGLCYSRLMPNLNVLSLFFDIFNYFILFYWCLLWQLFAQLWLFEIYLINSNRVECLHYSESELCLLFLLLCAACAVHCSGLLSHVARYEVVTPQRLAARQKRSLQDSQVSSSHLTVWRHRNFIRDQNPIYSQTVWWLLQKRSGRMVWISYRHFCPSEGCEYLYVLSDDWWTVFHSFTLIQSGTSWLSKGGITLFIWKKTGIWKTNSHLYDTFCI